MKNVNESLKRLIIILICTIMTFNSPLKAIAKEDGSITGFDKEIIEDSSLDNSEIKPFGLVNPIDEHECRGSGAWEITKQATCTQKGTKVRYCSVCNKKFSEEINALGHSYPERKICTEMVSCSRCLNTPVWGQPKEHIWQSATCTTKKKCSVCGYEEGSTADHFYGPENKCVYCGKTNPTQSSTSPQPSTPPQPPTPPQPSTPPEPDTSTDSGSSGTKNEDNNQTTAPDKVKYEGKTDQSVPVDPATQNSPLISDPVNVCTGAHIIDVEVIKINSAQSIGIGLHYESNKTTLGVFGRGFSWNYESHIEVGTDEIKVYHTPSTYIAYKLKSGSSTEYISQTDGYNNDVLIKSDDGRFILSSNQKTFEYDEKNRLSKVTSKTGQQIKILYSDKDIILKDGVSGQELVLTLNSQGLVEKLAYKENNATFCYDDNKYLTQIIDIDGNKTTYTYDRYGQVLTATDNEGNCYFTDIYDSNGRVISQRDANGNETKFECIVSAKDNSKTVSVINRECKKKIYIFDNKNQLISESDEAGNVTKYFYDERGNQTEVVDALGNSTKAEYNSRDLIISSVDALGRTTNYKYDNNDNLISITYPDKSEVTFCYDSNNRLISSVDLRGAKTNNVYDAEGYLIKTSNQDKETIYTYENGCIKTITDPMGNVTQFSYDENGCLSEIQDPSGAIVKNSFTLSGLTKQTVDALNNKKEFTYNCAGKIVTTIDEAGNVISNEYDKRNLLKASVDAMGNRTIYEYDKEERLIKIVFADGSTVTKNYDSTGRLISEIDAEGNKTSYNLDPVGNIIEEIKPNGGIIKYTYTPTGKIETKTQQDGDIMSYTYDETDRLKTVTNALGGVTKYSYNKAGDVLSITDANGNVISYEYDIYGNKKCFIDQKGNKTFFEYDKNGNVIKEIDAELNVIYYKYDKCNRLIEKKKAIYDEGKNVSEDNYSQINNSSNKTKLPYTVSYDLQEGKSDFDFATQEFYEGDEIRLYNEEPYRHLYVFLAWYSASTRRYYSPGEKITLEENLMLTPVWQKDIISITYEPNGASWNKYSNYYEYGELFTVYDPQGRQYYQFMGWNENPYADPEGSMTYCKGNCKGYATKSQTIYAIWQPCFSGMKLRISFETGCSDISIEPIEVIYGENFNHIPDSISRPGYLFEGWYTSEKGGYRIYPHTKVTATDTIKLYAHWTKLKEEVDYSVTSYEYDKKGQLVAIVDPLGNRTRKEYDSRGNLFVLTDANGCKTTHEYDKNNQLISIVNANNQRKKYILNNVGKVEQFVDELGQTSVFEYDKNGNIIKSVNTLNGVSSKNYDALGQVTQLIGPLSGTTSFEYDLEGKLISKSTIQGEKETYTYNSLDLIQEFTNARGQKISYEYDNIGQIKKAKLPDGEGEVTYSYDKNGNIERIKDKNGTVIREYDRLNRVISVTDENSRTVRYCYDSQGNLLRIYYPDNSYVEYTYDLSGNILSVTDWNGYVTSYSYDGLNRETEINNPDGSKVVKFYDNLGNLKCMMEYDSDDQRTNCIEYTYDNGNRLIKEYNSEKYEQYEYNYDDLNRVTKRIIRNTVDESIIDTESFEYDLACNITMSSNNNSSDIMTYNSVDNTLLQYKNEKTIFDKDGNMIQVSIKNNPISLSYDSQNRLIKAGESEYIYDAEAYRLSSTFVNSDNKIITSEYCYDRQNKNLLVKYDSDGTIEKYVYGNGLISAEKKCAGSDTSEYKVYHYDLRGSVTSITNKEGQETARYSYSTYGIRITEAGTDAEIAGYCGREGVLTDSNSLLYMRARYYAPELKRFINEDIVTGDISNSNSLNRYSYVEGNPVSMIDPFGLCAEKANSNRVFDGILKTIDGSLWSVIGGVAVNTGLVILATAGAPVTMIAAGLVLTTAGCFSIAYGISDGIEGTQDIYYGATGSSVESINPVRDTVFQGNVEDYETSKLIAQTTTMISMEAANELIMSYSNQKAVANDSKTSYGKSSGRQKTGPKPQGTGAHNLKIEEIASQVTDGTVIAGGGRICPNPEAIIQTPNGLKKTRRPDILVQRPDGTLYGVNVGKTTAKGAPIKREVEALYDLEDHGLPMYFVGYDK